MTDSPNAPAAVPAPKPKTVVPFADLARCHRDLKPQLDEAIARVFAKSSFIMGEEVAAFEKEMAPTLGVKHVIGCASCTSAAGIALRAFGIGPGHEVITTTHTMVATAESISQYAGARAVFCDLAPGTPNISPEAIERAITPRTRAIMPVHMYGIPCDMDPILEIARKHKLVVIEDCAQAQGAEYKGRRVGSIGDAAVFSFFPSKNLGCAGDGGALSTHRDDIATFAKKFSNHGRLEKFTHEFEAGNHRLDGLQAAILRVKLPHVDGWNTMRRAVAERYFERLRAIPGVTPPQNPDWARCVWHVFAIRLKSRDAVRKALAARGIETGLHYPLALHEQPALAYLGHKRDDFPEAIALCEETLSLPMFPELTAAQVDFVCDALADAVRQVG